MGNKRISPDIIDMLVEHDPGALNHVDQSGSTPVHWYCATNKNAGYEDDDIIQTFKDADPECFTRKNTNGDKPNLPKNTPELIQRALSGNGKSSRRRRSSLQALSNSRRRRSSITTALAGWDFNDPAANLKGTGLEHELDNSPLALKLKIVGEN